MIQYWSCDGLPNPAFSLTRLSHSTYLERTQEQDQEQAQNTARDADSRIHHRQTCIMTVPGHVVQDPDHFYFSNGTICLAIRIMKIREPFLHYHAFPFSRQAI